MPLTCHLPPPTLHFLSCVCVCVRETVPNPAVPGARIGNHLPPTHILPVLPGSPNICLFSVPPLLVPKIFVPLTGRKTRLSRSPLGI